MAGEYRNLHPACAGCGDKRFVRPWHMVQQRAEVPCWWCTPGATEPKPEPWEPLADGVSDEELKSAALALVLHPGSYTKQQLRALTVRLVATLVHERRRP